MYHKFLNHNLVIIFYVKYFLFIICYENNVCLILFFLSALSFFHFFYDISLIQWEEMKK